MYATIRHFMQALLTPDLSFRTLTDARAALTEEGLPRLHRTTRFAEAEISWNGARWLLAMPLHPSAMRRIERLVPQLRRCGSPALVNYRILPQELQTDGLVSDLVLQRLPEGRPLGEMTPYASGSALLAALDTLEQELRRAGFVHGNLKPANLIWSEGALYPVRYHDASFGVNPAGDAAAFEALRRQVREATGCDELHDATVAYAAVPQLEGHLWTGHPFEGLICVEDETGFGYVDAANRTVIPAQFRWAGDFREGRAEVETFEGKMGLIDRTGRYVLPPVYEIVEYDPATSRILARRDGLWAEFGYTGGQLTEFTKQSI